MLKVSKTVPESISGTLNFKKKPWWTMPPDPGCALWPHFCSEILVCTCRLLNYDHDFLQELVDKRVHETLLVEYQCSKKQLEGTVNCVNCMYSVFPTCIYKLSCTCYVLMLCINNELYIFVS